MPQRSHAYAVGRVQVLSKTLLGAGTLERLAAASTLAEAARVLTESGFGDVRGKKDIEDLASARTREACALVRECTPDQNVTDCFLIQYDALNLKSLVKARALKKPFDEVTLSECGLIDPEKLKRFVDEARYPDLPPELKCAMERIETRLAVAMDPLFVDAELDKAVFAFIETRAKRFSEQPLRTYFACRAEIVNLLIALRAAAMGRGGAFAKSLFVPGGTLSHDALIKVADEPDRAYALVQGRPYAQALETALKHGEVDAALAERAADDYLLSQIRPYRYETTSILPLVGYLLARAREAGALRLIATAKSSGVPEDQLLRRLRALY